MRPAGVLAIVVVAASALHGDWGLGAGDSTLRAWGSALPSTSAQASSPQVPAPSPQPPAASPQSVLSTYCVTCHNERSKTAGLVIDPSTLANIGGSAEVWEKVVRKLRGKSMPPSNMPRPDERTHARLVEFLETALDRAAAARPQLGRVSLAHRLSRTEYQNAVRDLLALEHLPREARVEYLLPPDNVSSGFDNIADLLFVSPTNLERYLDAARKISRLAVGDPAMPVMVNIHRIDAEHPQDARVEELPYGTRGGVAIRSEFPVDGTYVVKVELAGAPRDPQQLEITVDGARVRLESLGQAGGRGGRGGRGGPGGSAPTEFEFPLTLPAGPKLVGVAFLQRTEARDEATLRPRTRSRGTQPAIATVTISGPYNAKAGGDSPSRRRLFLCHPGGSGIGDRGPVAAGRESRRGSADDGPDSPERAEQVEACARRILSALARRAYRRPVTDVDMQELMPFYEAGRKEGGFDLGIQRGLERLLVSSQFLFRIERVPAGAKPGTPYRVSDLELASRLSFFLWSSIPDEELLSVAEAGTLRDARVLEAQVRRMLNDTRALVGNFAAQWLYLRDIESKVPDEVLFQDFDETLRQAMQRETELFVDSVFRENRPVTDLLTANYTFLNERLARHYGIANVRGSDFRRVTFPAGSVRGGLLGHGSVLTITSYANRTSPVLRGKWVLENLLSAAPAPPPADIPALSTDAGEPGKVLTMREAMAKHRASPACASCHARMDPIGFAMENFDAIGRWRERDGDHAIDASGTFPEGTRFEGIAGLKAELLRQKEQFVHTVADRLLMYALGRNLQYYDAPTVRAIVREAAPANYTLTALALGVVKSRPFQMRAE